MRPRLAIAGLAFIALGLVVWFGWWSPATSEATDQLRGQVRTIALDNGSGNVTIRATDTATTTVHQHYRYHWGKPGRSYRLDGDELTLGDCGWNCTVDYDVTVPRGAVVGGDVSSGELKLSGVSGVDVDVSSGDADIADVTGPVKLQADSGSVRLSDVTGRTDLDVSSGEVQAGGLRGPVGVDASSGNVRLELATPQDVRADASSGSIQILVPADAVYRVKADADSGEESINVRQDPHAPHVLDLHASSGNISASSR
jgi:hypothetical protein